MTKGEKIKAARESKGMTQEELGAACGSSKQSIYKYERGIITNIPSDKLEAIAAALDLDPAYIMGWDESPEEAIPYNPAGRAPIVGSIPAGYPVLAVEDIEGYADVPYSDAENYFFLRVSGDSMEPRICLGDLVLIRKQNTADNGQIVAARVNGDEATLKRYKRQGDTVLLLPENQKYNPYVILVSDFENGYAQIFGVVVELRRTI